MAVALQPSAAEEFVQVMNTLAVRSSKRRGAIHSMILDSARSHHWAVVLAGGDGTRLQELSYQVSGDFRPKQFCQFFGEKSLLRHTRDRIDPISREDRTSFVLARKHQKYYDSELADVDGSCKIIQPENRGTALAMALSLQLILQRDQDAVVAFFPSDHHYSDCSAFRASIATSLRHAIDYPNHVLMIGAEATYPEIEYGWIQPGRTLTDSINNPLRRVLGFWEKPTLQRAKRLQVKNCVWNTFVTIGLASAFFELLEATIPCEGCSEWSA